MQNICFVGGLVALMATSPGLAQSILEKGGSPNASYPGLHAWYRPESGINLESTLPADGTIVSVWGDSSVNGHDLTRVNRDVDRRPVLRHDTGNGMPAVEFDGDDYIWAASTEFGTVSEPRTIFAVVRVDAANGGYVFDSSSSGGRNALLTGQSASPGVWNLYTGTGTVLGPTIGSGYLQLVTMTLTPEAQSIRINGELVGDGAVGLSNMVGMIVGARYSVTNALIGGVCEILYYDEALDAKNLSLVENHLATKYDLETPPPPPPSSIVFEVGTDGYPNIRIPSIVQLDDGTLLAFAEARFGGDHAQNDIVLKRSFDGGDTWGPLQLLDDQGGDSLNDPLPVVVREGPHAGRIYLHYMSFPQGCHTSCVSSGYGPNSSHNWLMWSDDDGATWTEPLDVTTIFRRENVNFAGSPGVGIQLQRGEHAGRLVFMLRQGPVGSMRGYTVHSDDGGETWTMGELVDNGPDGGTADEISIEELEDGTILANTRTFGSTKRREQARSVDGGVTFGPFRVDDELVSPHCMGSIILYQATDEGFDTSRLLYCGPWSETSRSNGSVVISEDGGETWGDPVTVVPGGFAYSQMVVLDPCGEVGIFYEADGYNTMRFIRVSLEQLTNGDVSTDDLGPCSESPCTGDLDGDGQVAGADLGLMLGAFGTADAFADLDGSGTVDGGDLGLLLGAWGPCP